MQVKVTLSGGDRELIIYISCHYFSFLVVNFTLVVLLNITYTVTLHYHYYMSFMHIFCK